MAILTAATIGTLIGGITGILPGIIDFLNTREKLKYESKSLEMKYDHAKKMSEIETANKNLDADIAEGESLRRHDNNIDSKGFIGAMRSSIRPVITYGFFLLFITVKALTVYVFLNSGMAGDVMNNTVAWNEFVPLIWDKDTQAIFGAVIGFWFGGRIIEKLKRS